ncbi:hypothetical protein DBR39_13680 [Chryseobacterium sp. KBW03]|uniref:hypothetical protein n=1 Tax=Chryseobacterium sp. KBW03 TaxID=2153362 RepID=UPI000F59D35A|nr:hypothetical protein [Chryseobacterium sp. KBW03]RQO37934.1 hypothetical protein DBR39_13680 [Chryseobacterium sp. KBW03]
MEHRYTANNERIKVIQEALNTCIMGSGFATIFTVTVEKVDNDRSTLVFKSDRESPINPMEFFEFGIIVGRDYVSKIER